MNRILVATALMLAATLPATAQESAFQIAIPSGTGDATFFAGQAEVAMPFFESAVEVVGVEPLDFGDPVTGAPYTAQATTEVTQQLADGNRIERRTSSTVARDTRGRVRREQQLAAIGPFANTSGARIVTIIDPVARVHYSLNEERKTATRLPLPTMTRFSASGSATSATTTAVGGATAGVRVTMAGAATPSSMEFKNERLAPTTMEGVRVEGTKSTMTIPTGAIGNQAPIEVVTERWYSPELKAVVYSRRSDPRVGDTIYKLENIVRAEPAAELFKVPADYAVQAPR